MNDLNNVKSAGRRAYSRHVSTHTDISSSAGQTPGRDSPISSWLKSKHAFSFSSDGASTYAPDVSGQSALSSQATDDELAHRGRLSSSFINVPSENDMWYNGRDLSSISHSSQGSSEHGVRFPGPAQPFSDEPMKVELGACRVGFTRSTTPSSSSTGLQQSAAKLRTALEEWHCCLQRAPDADRLAILQSVGRILDVAHSQQAVANVHAAATLDLSRCLEGFPAQTPATAKFQDSTQAPVSAAITADTVVSEEMISYARANAAALAEKASAAWQVYGNLMNSQQQQAVLPMLPREQLMHQASFFPGSVAMPSLFTGYPEVHRPGPVNVDPGSAFGIGSSESDVSKHEADTAAGRHISRGIQKVPGTSESEAAGSEVSLDAGAKSLRANFDEMCCYDEDSILIVRNITRLGFDAAELLLQYFSQFGRVERFLVTHRNNKAKPVRMPPSGPGFVVMADTRSAQAILQQGQKHTITTGRNPDERVVVSVGPYKHRHGTSKNGEEE